MARRCLQNRPEPSKRMELAERDARRHQCAQLATDLVVASRFAQQLMLNPLVDGVAYLTVDLELLLLRPSSLTRVGEAPVQALPGSKEHGARLVGLITDSDHCVERFVDIAIESLALLAGNVDAELGHRADRQWSDVRRFSPGRERIEASTAKRAEEAFGHLAPRGVVRAQEQDAFLRGGLIHPTTSV